jgi:hypothetical protein
MLAGKTVAGLSIIFTSSCGTQTTLQRFSKKAREARGKDKTYMISPAKETGRIDSTVLRMLSLQLKILFSLVH